MVLILWVHLSKVEVVSKCVVAVAFVFDPYEIVVEH